MSKDLRHLMPDEPRGRPITIDFEGRPVRAFEGEPVAVALWAAGLRVLARSPKYHRPRGLFCLEGHCASCYLRIDGRPNLRSCLAPAVTGTRCERQNAFLGADVDLLRAADWLFPRGMDHHRMMTGSRLGNELFLKMVRQMGGSGTLPDEPPEDWPAIGSELWDLCVVGAGPAGLAAATAAAENRPGLRVTVLDEQDRAGGSWLAEPGGLARADALVAAARTRGVRVWTSSTALAYFPEDRDFPARAGAPDGVLAVVRPQGLVRVSARRFLYATGAYDQGFPVPDGDRPGVLSARACGRLAFRWGVQPGRRVTVAVDPEVPFSFADTLLRGLGERDIPAVRINVADLAHAGLDLKRDAVALAALPAPASELPRQHGAAVRLQPLRGGFTVQVSPGGETTAPGVFAAGDVTGYRGPEEAAKQGSAAGREIAAGLA